MNDSNDPTQTQAGPEVPATPQPAGFCQHCGKPLTTETIRQVGPAVYCEPCLAARMAGTPGAPPPPGATGYRPVNAGPNNWTGATYNTSSGPNPGLAALLGLIPGVGAMYNEQYAKGVIHLIVFAVLVSLSDNVNGIFGLFVAGWIFYMAIEAHHTARARRDGTPLPNPFGLNDIGERLGFGKSWPQGPSVAQVANDAAAAAAGGFNPSTAPPPYQQPPVNPTWGAPTDYPQTPYDPHAAAQHTAQDSRTYAQSQVYRDTGYAPTGFPPASPYTQTAYAPVPPLDPNAPAPVFVPTPSRFPAGAVVLIGLGVIFLLTTTGFFNGVSGESVIGCVLLGIGAWIFLRRMMDDGYGPTAADGSPYSYRLLRATRGSVWLIVLGILFLLAAFNIASLTHSWPTLIILGGVMALLSRAVYQANAAQYLQQPPLSVTPPIVTPPPAAESNESTHGGN